MTPAGDRSFGILIAYVLPGFSALALWGADSAPIGTWLAASRESAPTVGGFLYVTLASVGIGLVLSTVRWVLLDHVLHLTGIRPPAWTSGESDARIRALELLIEHHYRYYQFYGSSGLVLLAAAAALPPGLPVMGRAERWCVAALGMLFLVAARDALSKYYQRAAQVTLADPRSNHERKTTMTNGAHGDTKTTAPAGSKNVQPSTAEQTATDSGRSAASGASSESSKADSEKS